jgi:hypothetical protein
MNFCNIDEIFRTFSDMTAALKATKPETRDVQGERSFGDARNSRSLRRFSEKPRSLTSFFAFLKGILYTYLS